MEYSPAEEEEVDAKVCVPIGTLSVSEFTFFSSKIVDDVIDFSSRPSAGD